MRESQKSGRNEIIQFTNLSADTAIKTLDEITLVLE